MFNCIHQQKVWRLERLQSIAPPCSTCRSESRSSCSLADGYFMLFPATKLDQTPFLSYLYHLVSPTADYWLTPGSTPGCNPKKMGWKSKGTHLRDRYRYRSLPVRLSPRWLGRRSRIPQHLRWISGFLRWSTRQLTISALGWIKAKYTGKTFEFTLW